MKFKDVIRHSMKAHYLSYFAQSWEILAWMKIQHTELQEGELEADGPYYQSEHGWEDFSCVRIRLPNLMNSCWSWITYIFGSVVCFALQKIFPKAVLSTCCETVQPHFVDRPFLLSLPTLTCIFLDYSLCFIQTKLDAMS